MTVEAIKQHGMDTAKNLAFAAVGTLVLFGLSKHVKQLPLPTNNLYSALSSAAATGLLATGAQKAYSWYVGDKDKEKTYVNVALLFGAAVLANVALAQDLVKGKVSFLDMDLSAAAANAAFATGSVAGLSYITRSLPKIEKADFEAEMTKLTEALTAAHVAYKAKVDAEEESKEEKAAWVKAKGDVDTFAKKHDFSKEQNETITALKKDATYIYDGKKA